MVTEDLLDLPKELQNRLNLIMQTVPRFWEQKRYRHITNQGPAHSQRVHEQKLTQLTRELPDQHRLSVDEKFIVSAAAWLYETGMQSPDLRPILDFDLRPGQSPSLEQLQAIRAKKHLLTQRLIIDSVRSDYKGPPIWLGLIPYVDEYTNAIAEVCRWCCDEPLEWVPEFVPVNGLPVRIRLLVALLRLADQLYIDSSRVDLDFLESANLPPSEKARWWAYHYTQTLPIVNRKIPFYYCIPLTQKEYLGYIRALIEPQFQFQNNPGMRFLWDTFNLTVVPNPDVNVKYDTARGFLREMSPELTGFLRAEVRAVSPITFSTEADVQSAERSMSDPVQRHLESLTADYAAAYRHLGTALSEVERVRLRRYIAELEQEITQTKSKLDSLTFIRDVQLEGVKALVTGPHDRSSNKPITILFLAANPSDTTQLRLFEEHRAISATLRMVEFRDRFDLILEGAVRTAELQGHLLRYNPDIVHFSGHGSEEGEIVFESDDEVSRPVSPRALSNLFSILKGNIRCVLLNACFTEEQAKAIAEHIDAVIGMSDEINDKAAINFAAAFYQALGFGKNVKTAFDLGCNLLDLSDLEDKDTPILIALRCKPEEIRFVDGSCE